MVLRSSPGSKFGVCVFSEDIDKARGYGGERDPTASALQLAPIHHIGRGEPLREYETFEFFGVNGADLAVVCSQWAMRANHV